MYDNLVNVIHNEMKDKLCPMSKSGRRKSTPLKPYWHQDLSNLWKITSEKENVYFQCKGNRNIKEQLRQSFKNARNNFDKLLKKRQRAYRRGFLLDVERCNTSDPKQFWKLLEKLGPSRKGGIPWEVYDENGILNSDKETVLNKWKSEYYK